VFSKKYRVLIYLGIGLVIVCSVCELMLARSTTALLQYHQAQWDCLAKENARIPHCVEAHRPMVEDVDYCNEAVLACKALGAYDLVIKSDDEYATWGRTARRLRLVVLLVGVVCLVWFGVIRRLSRKMPRDEN